MMCASVYSMAVQDLSDTYALTHMHCVTLAVHVNNQANLLASYYIHVLYTQS